MNPRGIRHPRTVVSRFDRRIVRLVTLALPQLTAHVSVSRDVRARISVLDRDGKWRRTAWFFRKLPSWESSTERLFGVHGLIHE